MSLGDTGLLPDERLIWEGAPRRVPIVATSDLAVVPAVILLLWIGQGIKRYLQARTSSFVVTDRRVVVRRKGADVRSRYLSDLGPPRLAEHAGGTGTITFGGGFSPVSWEVRGTVTPSRRCRSWSASRTRAASAT